MKTINRPNDVLAADRGRDGKITLVTASGSCLRLDRDGGQISSFVIGNLPESGSSGALFALIVLPLLVFAQRVKAA